MRLRHALAGLQAGVLGAILMLGWIMLGSIFDQRSVWVVPNLFASAFYGVDAYRNEFLHTSWAGVAMLIAIYGALGIPWGCVWRENSKPRLALYGTVFGLVVYYFLFHFIWPRANGLIVLYAPTRTLILGHMLWGLTLAQKSPKFARQIRDSVSSSIVHEQEVKTGEVIQ